MSAKTFKFTVPPPGPASEQSFPELFLFDADVESIDENSITDNAAPPEVPVAIVTKPSALEAMPHLVKRIIGKWRSRELNTMVHHILLDTRDGARQGFPPEAVQELMFLAELNLIARACEAAPLLQISLSEACTLVAKGDQAALGLSSLSLDVWGGHAPEREKSRNFHASPLARNFHPPLNQNGTHSSTHGKTQHLTHNKQHSQLAAILNQTPPIPPSVRIDLTTPKALRPGPGSDDGENTIMDWGFFRCIAKELGELKIKRLVLSSLGDSAKCDWLPAAIRFSKTRCNIPEVVLHCDILSAPEQQLASTMTAGLNQLVINFNMASGKWAANAEALTHSDPGHFRKLIERLIKVRNEIAASTNNFCAISVVEIGRSQGHHLHQAFRELSQLVGILPFRWDSRSLSPEIPKHEKLDTGSCRCWAPFIEAHIRTNGHLVACALDHSGYSFAADLKEITFSDAWLGQTFKDTRQRVLSGEKPGRLCDICHHRA